MTKNYFYNALIASAYITVLCCTAFYGGSFIKEEWFANTPQVIYPIGFLSLFVFSAAFMAFTFFYNPILLFLDGKKKEGTELFLKTLGIFAGLSVAIFATFFLATSL